MKKVVLACLLMVTHLNYAHTADNWYYAFIKHNTTSFIESLSIQDKIECLDFFSGKTEPKMSWFKQLNACFENLYAKFLDAYTACIADKKIEMNNEVNHKEIFGIYSIVGLYRIIYESVLEEIKSGAITCENNWPHPDQIDAECLSQIHN